MKDHAERTNATEWGFRPHFFNLTHLTTSELWGFDKIDD